jgi:hypothetical protein
VVTISGQNFGNHPIFTVPTTWQFTPWILLDGINITGTSNILAWSDSTIPMRRVLA